MCVFREHLTLRPSTFVHAPVCAVVYCLRVCVRVHACVRLHAHARAPLMLISSIAVIPTSNLVLVPLSNFIHFLLGMSVAFLVCINGGIMATLNILLISAPVSMPPATATAVLRLAGLLPRV